MMKRTLVVVFAIWTLGMVGGDRRDGRVLHWPVSAALHAQQPAPQDEFVPIDELPPQDQLPAAPLLVTAYAFVVLALFAYLLSVARRLGGVQRDLERLESDLKRTGRA
jgi:CcmD family protein